MSKAQQAAIGYVRVSTEDQATEGVSLDAQREKIKAYCDLHGLALVGVEADEGISGKRADNRPGLQRALDLTCEHKAVLVCYSLSRLARSTLDCIQIVQRIDKCGADLASISEKIDTTSSMGRFVFRLMASLGELEREQVSERTTAAMGHLRRQKRRISGNVPYGFRLTDDGVLVSDEAEQQGLATIRRLRRQGLGTRKIADALNDEGIKPKSGQRWYPSSVLSVLKSDALRKGKTVVEFKREWRTPPSGAMARSPGLCVGVRHNPTQPADDGNRVHCTQCTIPTQPAGQDRITRNVHFSGNLAASHGVARPRL